MAGKPQTKTPTFARGVPVGIMQKIAVNFPPDAFEAIRARAVRDRCSFAEMVRRLCAAQIERDGISDEG